MTRDDPFRPAAAPAHDCAPAALPDDPAAASAVTAALLARAGLRVTRPRQVIVEVLLRADDHPDAEAVLARARAIEPGVSQATTYRTISVLAEKGILRTHHFDSGPARYEMDRPHHDHLVDVDTGAVIEFLSEEIERLQQRIAARYGYDIMDHQLVLYGRRRPGGETGGEGG